VFTFYGTGTSRLAGITVRGGAQGIYAEGFPIEAHTLTVESCVVEQNGNTGIEGGGVYAIMPVIVRSSIVRDNVAGDPLFLVMTPFAPHGPFTPAPRHVDAWTPRTPYTNAAVNERNMSDKPAFLQGRSAVSRTYIKRAQTKSGQTLMAVDESVRQVIKALGPEKENTLLVFMSDNGLMWGEHRLKDKYQPYRWSTEVPLSMRWDGHILAGSVGGLAAIKTTRAESTSGAWTILDDRDAARKHMP